MNYDDENAMATEIGRLKESIDTMRTERENQIREALTLLDRMKVAQLDDTKHALAVRIETILRSI